MCIIDLSLACLSFTLKREVRHPAVPAAEDGFLCVGVVICQPAAQGMAGGGPGIGGFAQAGPHGAEGGLPVQPSGGVHAFVHRAVYKRGAPEGPPRAAEADGMLFTVAADRAAVEHEAERLALRSVGAAIMALILSCCETQYSVQRSNHAA